ncbi:major facilitator superfamily domain-containing protein [Penicillium argentinense]|uniref:Major facilitator superfamily domain-containing protein n=1 Tax=Penicillium argentinense TaxID=1131581 RepID=A0A9W9KEY4_9EURO|nr:major facilitator superfamily domain-containing protein [Penicillium argentinense]KAJ5103183.1 major facilitator superfamily domain-containing protein [Penicillium argentinense]
MCLNLCIYSAIRRGIIYLFFGAFQAVFVSVYNFELWQRGILFLLVGMVSAVLSDPYWRSNYCRLERNHRARDNSETLMPEWRLLQRYLACLYLCLGN